MKLEDLGITLNLRDYLKSNDLEEYTLGRVTAEHKERYLVRTEEAEIQSEITGNLRFSATGRSDFPAVGDWVCLSVLDASLGIIHRILPRISLLERRAVGKFAEKQVIAANIDYALIIQGADRDFNLNRLERCLAISQAARITPIVLLSKIDLVDEKQVRENIECIKKRNPNVSVLPFSNVTKQGYEQLFQILAKGKTYCFIGSSGVGKSTLSNHLSGKEVMRTSTTSTSTGKGRHTTSHRELIVLENGSILIDTPGMREIGVTELVEDSFDVFETLASQCKFNDCSHQQDEGCAIIAALEQEEIDHAAYENYLKMLRESSHFQASVAEKRKKDKAFGKMYKAVVKHRKRTKF